MSLMIPDEFLETAQISARELKVEIALLLLQKQKITLNTASQFSGVNPSDLQRILARNEDLIHHDVPKSDDNLRATKAEHSAPETDISSQSAILQRIEQRRTFQPSKHNLPDTLKLIQEDRSR